MQGFNKYYPPDYDPDKHSSLNAYHGKHALGDRARKLSQGVLITRFELPFNIWCGTCDAHIGMGVRYNAEKRKVGNYFSTPIYAFRCKCHLCSGWFEVQTDPKNTRYVVTSGARQKNEEWDPEANGGYAIHDTEGAGPSDPLAAVEKTADAETRLRTVQAPRLEELQAAADAQGEDPYSHSLRVRKRFRAEKKTEQARAAVDTALRDKYALPEALALVRDDADTAAQDHAEWERARAVTREADSNKRRRIADRPLTAAVRSGGSGSSRGKPAALSALGQRILQNTARRTAGSRLGNG